EAAADTLARGLLPDNRLVLCLLAAREPEANTLVTARRAVRRLSVGHAIAASVDSRDGAVLVASLEDPVLRTLPPSGLGLWTQGSDDSLTAVGQSSEATLCTLNEA